MFVPNFKIDVTGYVFGLTSFNAEGLFNMNVNLS